MALAASVIIFCFHLSKVGFPYTAPITADNRVMTNNEGIELRTVGGEEPPSTSPVRTRNTIFESRFASLLRNLRPIYAPFIAMYKPVLVEDPSGRWVYAYSMMEVEYWGSTPEEKQAARKKALKARNRARYISSVLKTFIYSILIGGGVYCVCRLVIAKLSSKEIETQGGPPKPTLRNALTSFGITSYGSPSS